MTVRLVEIFIALSRRKSVILEEETAKQNLPRAELIGFVRLAFLRKNKKVCLRVPLSLMSLMSYCDSLAPLRHYLTLSHFSLVDFTSSILCTLFAEPDSFIYNNLF